MENCVDHEVCRRSTTRCEVLEVCYKRFGATGDEGCEFKAGARNNTGFNVLAALVEKETSDDEQVDFAAR